MYDEKISYIQIMIGLRKKVSELQEEY